MVQRSLMYLPNDTYAIVRRHITPSCSYCILLCRLLISISPSPLTLSVLSAQDATWLGCFVLSILDKALRNISLLALQPPMFDMSKISS